MTTENGLLLPSVMARHIDRLRNRADFLEGRMAARDAAGPHTGDVNGFDRGEHQALMWAIPVLEAEHMAAIRLARHVLAMAGVPVEKRDAMIASGHPR